MSLPKEIRPIFRDALELAGGVLAKEIETALYQSKYLIVICSPNSAKSPWVNREIQTFIDLGREKQIIPFIIDGTPFSKDPEKECFPPALRSLRNERELLGININEMGYDAAAVKVVACMFGLKFDALWQRYEREKKKKKNWIILVSFMVFLCVSGIAISMYLQNIQIQKANREMKENLMRFVSEKAMMLTDDGDSYTARLLALSLLPNDVKKQVYLPEAEAALRHASAHNSAVLKGHTNAVNDVKYSSDGKQLLSCSYDGTIKLWDAQTGECLKTFVGHTNMVDQVDFCFDNASIISCSIDGTINVWDLSSGKIIKSFNDTFFYRISPDKKYIITDFNGVPGVYDGLTYKLITEITGFENWGDCCWYPDNQWISVYTNKHEFLKVNLWTNQTIHVANNKDDSILSSHVVDPQGKFIAAVLINYIEETSYVRVWDIKTGLCLHTLRGNRDGINCVAFSPDGNRIVTTSMDGSVRIWNTANGTCQYILKGHSFASGSPTYSPNGKCIATTSADATIRIYDSPDTGVDLRITESDQYVYAISYLPDGKQLLVASDDSLCIYNSPNWEWVRTLYKQDAIVNMSYSPTNDAIGLALKNNLVGLYDVQSQEVKILAELTVTSCPPSFSQDGKQIAFASCDSTIHIWEVTTGEKQNTIFWNQNIRGISYADNSRQMVIASDSSLTVYDIVDSMCMMSWKTPEISLVSTTTSPDGKFVLTSSENIIYVWDIDTGQCVSKLDEHISAVYACAFSPDCKYIVSTSHNTEVKVWDWKSGICVASEKLGQYLFAQFSSDSRHIAMANTSGGVHFWDFPPLQELIDKTRERFKNRQLTPEERRKYYLE